jgi:Protein of unknown function (DUF3800)
MSRVLYIFLDEAGNFDFSIKGTPYFILCSLTKERAFSAYQELSELKYDLIESGSEIEYFHATEDRQEVRNRVFGVISKHLQGCTIDATVVEKRKAESSLHEMTQFYPKMLGHHLKCILEQVDWAGVTEVIVVTDRIPVNNKRQAVEKAVKQTLAEMLPQGAIYRVLHHDSKSNFDLQIADYCTWALHRKWSSQDIRSYQLIRAAVRSEFDIYRAEGRHYY